MTKAEVIEHLKELSIEERYEIFNEISGEGDAAFASPEIESAWSETIRQRSQEIKDGAVEAVSWSDVKKKMRTI